MREPPRITEEDLRACLQDQYDLSPVTLTFLALGHDYDAGIYRVASEQGTAYALKVTTRSLYEPRCLVPRYLYDLGIASVVAPIPTRCCVFSGLWTGGDRLGSPHLLAVGTGRTRSDRVYPQRVFQGGLGRRKQGGGRPVA